MIVLRQYGSQEHSKQAWTSLAQPACQVSVSDGHQTKRKGGYTFIILNGAVESNRNIQRSSRVKEGKMAGYKKNGEYRRGLHKIVSYSRGLFCVFCVCFFLVQVRLKSGRRAPGVVLVKKIMASSRGAESASLVGQHPVSRSHPVTKARGCLQSKHMQALLGSGGRGTGRRASRGRCCLSPLLLLLVHQGLIPESDIVLIATI